MVCHLSYTVVDAPDCPTAWALPDQLVVSTASALLRICGAHPEHADRAVTSIINFITDIVENPKDSGYKDFIYPSTQAF
jgi:phosphatidylinositol 4-kinase